MGGRFSKQRTEEQDSLVRTEVKKNDRFNEPL